MKKIVAMVMLLLFSLGLVAGIYWLKKPEIKLEGIYISQSDERQSWVEFQEKEKGVISCRWHSIIVTKNNTLREQKLDFTGTRKERRLDLSKHMELPQPIDIEVAGMWEDGKVTLTFRSNDRELFTDEYHQTDSIALAAQISQFKRSFSDKAANEKEKTAKQQAEIQESQKQKKMQNDLVIETNKYISKMKNFLGNYKNVIEQIRKNTFQVENYASHLNDKEAGGAANALLKRQVVDIMREDVRVTGEMLTEHSAFVSEFNGKMNYFYQDLESKKKQCNAQDAAKDSSDQSLCEIVDKASKSMLAFMQQVVGTVKEVNAVFETELKQQKDTLAEAEKGL